MLVDAITSSKAGQVEAFFEWALDTYITPESLQYAIDNNIDVISTAIQTYGVNDPLIEPLFKILVKKNWKTIETYFIEPDKMRQLLTRKPDCHRILDTPQGIRYLNNSRKHAYTYLYKFVWGVGHNA